jgi:hypothetical protein
MESLRAIKKKIGLVLHDETRDGRYSHEPLVRILDYRRHLDQDYPLLLPRTPFSSEPELSSTLLTFAYSFHYSRKSSTHHPSKGWRQIC